MKILKAILGAIWAGIPGLIIWPLYILPFWAMRLLKLKGRFGTGLVFEAQFPKWAKPWEAAWGSWGGHGLPFCAVVVPGVSEDLIRHEMRHVSQWYALGIMFLPVYGLFLVTFGYRDNPMEVDARGAE